MKRIMHNAWQTAVLSALLLTVTAGYAQTKQYPYVQDGTIIVCREGADGVKSSLIHPNWTTTPSHNELDTINNRFAAKFELYDGLLAGGWRGACTYRYDGQTGWRLPTIRELRLISAFRNELTYRCLDENDVVWSATEDSSNDGSVWCIHIGSGVCSSMTISGDTGDNKHSLYCIRDL